ncbi:uncharacterized protein C8Q71DRAFT_599843 [Rhodofomes roseus]|uniref:Uncharacterized protein n=1 Tax=Rhodofomes roseus TaxID=34475 RepID=A0ABQ8KIB6_9APHY|nr:uncharacterized protein C8Q71DRAFT_42911 [Rhodofomes roseus]XP_047779563.1 uncharacterized protein C8Q71DRAFT_599843 [Rhodofomes roseus]KAH9836459.1 hypothetical protein C8Q71DRAFT_42911 [Rhodofomes roseus]KAH9837394.1 hypothetical protein C8Q71DRAFT_599843 [Rhodofomes roseus]
MSFYLCAAPFLVLYSPQSRRFARHSGEYHVSKKLRPCLVTAVDGDWICLAPCLSARPESQMKRSSWSIVDYGKHGPTLPDHPLHNAPVFSIPLRSRRQRGWKATSCFVWTRDEGEWISIADWESTLGARVLDSDFDLSPGQMAILRGKHWAIWGGNQG